MNNKKDKKPHTYVLVHFPEDGEGSFDIVPREWVKVIDKDKLVCPFISVNATEKELAQCQDLVKNCEPALETYENYPIEIRGHANTYVDAETRLRELKTTAYNFSTGDSDGGETAQKIKRYFLNKQKSQNKLKISELLNQGSRILNSKKVKNVGRNLQNPGSRSSEQHRKYHVSESEEDVSGSSASDQSDYDEKKKSDESVSESKSPKASQQTFSTSGGAKGILKPGTDSDKKKPQISSVENMNIIALLTKIQHDITEIKCTQQQIKIKVTKIEQRLTQSTNEDVQPSTSTAVRFKELFSDTVEKFDTLDTRLKNDKDFTKQMILFLRKQVNTEQVVQRNIGEILKKLVTKEVLEGFTAQKATKNKQKIFSKTEMWSCIKESFDAEWAAANLPALKDKALIKGLGAAMNSSRDWGKKKSKEVVVPLENNEEQQAHQDDGEASADE